MERAFELLYNLSVAHKVLLGTLFVLGWAAVDVFYQLVLHPLRHVPGPKLAAASEWYTLRYHVKDGGRLSDRIGDMHKVYGPIVRMAPNEVHISDPAFHDTLFNFKSDFDKPKYNIDNLQFTASSEHHKRRRRTMDSFFSRASTLKLEWLIVDGVNKMCQRMSEAREAMQPANLAVLYRALSADVICEYAFSETYAFLDDIETSHKFFAENAQFFGAMYLIRDIAVVSWLVRFLTLLPASWMSSPDRLGVVEFQQASGPACRKTSTIKVSKTIRDMSKPKPAKAARAHPTVFEQYLRSDLPSADKSSKAQLDMAMLLVSAGFETSGNTLATAHYHVLANPQVLRKLKSELESAWPDLDRPPTWSELEKVSYLRGVIQEALRLSLAAIGRLSRVNHANDLEYGGYRIPKGTIVSMSHRFINFDPELFPEPSRFDPERWLQGEKSRELERKFHPFSKGQRGCLGINLAYAEMYLALAAVFRRFDMELHDTTRKDIDPVYDHFVPAAETTKGVRVLIR